MEIQPYLFFEGRCEEALEFYRGALGAEVLMMMRYDESPEPPPEGLLPPGAGQKIMHACLGIGDAQIMASDGCCSGEPKFGSVAVSITVPDATTADRFFLGLAEGGRVEMPLGETFWSPRFGMVVDRFGVTWMINQLADQPPRTAAI